MKEIDDAIKVLALRAGEDSKCAHESMQLAQAILSLTQAKSVQAGIDQHAKQI